MYASFGLQVIYGWTLGRSSDVSFSAGRHQGLLAWQSRWRSFRAGRLIKPFTLSDAAALSVKQFLAALRAGFRSVRCPLGLDHPTSIGMLGVGCHTTGGSFGLKPQLQDWRAADTRGDTERNVRAP